MSNSAFTPTFAQNLQDASATQSGLVNTSAQTLAGKKTLDGGAAIKGDTTGNAIAAGYVGEVKSGSASVTNFTYQITRGVGVYATDINISFDRGIYLMFVKVLLSPADTVGLGLVGIKLKVNGNGGSTFNDDWALCQTYRASANDEKQTLVTLQKVVTITSNSIPVTVESAKLTGSVTVGSELTLQAIRIA